MANTWTTLLDAVYPIGSVYSAYTSTSPATRFGGTWSAITGRFPYYNAGTGTGGANTHTLTVAQMPSHSHNYGDNWTWDVSQGTNTGNWNISSTGEDWWGNAHMNNSPSRGGGEAHNNMPAYQTLYAWRRTA